MQSNSKGFIEDDSKKSMAEMTEKVQLVSFPTEGVHSNAVFDKLQELPGSYLVVCESMVNDDTDFRNVRRLVAAAEGVSLYSRVIKLQSDHRGVQTKLSWNRQVIMLSKFGEENLKIDLNTGSRAKNVELEERLQRYKDLMDEAPREGVTPLDVVYDPRTFFKT